MDKIAQLDKKSLLISLKINSQIWRKIKHYKLLYVMLAVPCVLVFIFNYMPIYGVMIAFKDFRYDLGIIGSKWNNFAHFKTLFSSGYFYVVLRNTVIISFLRIIFVFPAPIILALLLNEILNTRFKKIIQTISYLPNFMSWVVLAGIIGEILSPQRGIINYILTLLGLDSIYFLTSTTFFRPILILSSIWQGVGWGAIIYLATISAIDIGMYEAAEIDGAKRFQKVFHITLPSISPVIVLLFILSFGSILDAGFDQIFNLYNPLVYDVADVIDTYVYRMGILSAQYDFTAAVGLFKNVIGISMIFIVNTIAKKFSDYTIW